MGCGNKYSSVSSASLGRNSGPSGCFFFSLFTLKWGELAKAIAEDESNRELIYNCH